MLGSRTHLPYIMGRCVLRLFALGAALRLFLLQRPLDAGQEEGVLLDALPLEVVLELIEQLGGHLEGYGSLILFHGRFTLLLIEFCNEFGHVLTQCLPGRLLPLPHLSVEGLRDLDA